MLVTFSCVRTLWQSVLLNVRLKVLHEKAIMHRDIDITKVVYLVLAWNKNTLSFFYNIFYYIHAYEAFYSISELIWTLTVSYGGSNVPGAEHASRACSSKRFLGAAQERCFATILLFNQNSWKKSFWIGVSIIRLSIVILFHNRIDIKLLRSFERCIAVPSQHGRG